ncbi:MULTISPECIES: type II toxin-antitoxin system RelE/ParE family toxin [unclassified Okeania]|uniref:type II toxin-antitoxin system RelE/ParE family toxin n=1 Tax=unclassified Okeania TaxID=2634635 RepID=UPI0013BCB84C|nr:MULTISPECIES: type II toxin-antitoxin system RelE/ParE family toxin [unclassified Okeania]NET13549.1 type II toxin-antitoxin system RelE/ParE family toxin [Okeania sp. SIO1H6]NES77386.1 type II toxin-antitoxin system RelE/ParE family toxin [Okeania sp. SIO1H4]NET20999.1 type II toxin-antitoxin system RelE/ParE family toxin [Okeania sp. SIO1H5]NET77176.1 type II toxin-antitoxin system RelE/ParE family toxin [Okeania sp. SIO1F9]NET94223.1 type II toxin-antitoxin system RelE/ParE family toxin 
MVCDFHPEAQREMQEAVAYYDTINSILADKFIAEAEFTLNRIEKFPEAWPKLSANTRRCRILSFPYGIVYKHSESRILVVAVMHLQRKPNYWIDRSS